MPRGASLSRVSLGGVRDEAEISLAIRRTLYRRPAVARIIQMMKKAGTVNPIFRCWDEVDRCLRTSVGRSIGGADGSARSGT